MRIKPPHVHMDVLVSVNAVLEHYNLKQCLNNANNNIVYVIFCIISKNVRYYVP